MASKSRKRKNRRNVRAGLGQRVAVTMAVLVLVLCAASITFGVFVRQGGTDRGALRLAVRNGSGVAGVARHAEAALGRMGVVVVDVGNAERSDYTASTLVVRRRGADVDVLASRLGCERVVTMEAEDATEDAWLILGSDYRRLNLEWGAENGLADP